tara:strand:+ start:2891 stop:6163 length:3273 start_codon:yes stop_codon:yes gene_type:complete
MNIPKNIKIKKDIVSKTTKNGTKKLCQKKIQLYKKIIQDSILYVQKYKILDIIDAGELNLCVKNLEKIFNDCILIEEIILSKKKNKSYDQIIDKLQSINDELSVNFKSYGTKNIEDLLMVIFGNNYIKTFLTPENEDLFNIIKKYLHPTNFKLIDWKITKSSGVKKPIIKNKIVEDFTLAESANTLDCFDLARTTNKFQSKVYGIKICFQNSEKKKILVVSCIADDMLMNCIESKFIKNKLLSLKKNKPKDDSFLTEDFSRFLDSLTLKELLIYNEKELFHKYAGYLSQSNLIKKKTISQVIKEFISDDLYQQRKTLILLLIKNNDPEFQYLAYLLYDLLSAENGNSYDTLDQTILFDSLPWPIKKYFRDAMKTTIKYTKNLSNFDINKIPIEQQICLMKASDKVKEKAMLKLKEVKAKSEDSGSKARQYLDGLLRIPFGIFRNENILSLMNHINTEFISLVTELKKKDPNIKIKEKEVYNYIEIKNYINYLRNDYCTKNKVIFVEKLKKYLTSGKKDNLIYNTSQLNSIIKKLKLKHLKIKYSGKKNNQIKTDITLFLDNVINNNVLFEEIIKKYNKKINFNSICLKSQTLSLENKWSNINTSFKDIHDSLDKSIYGHKKAKRQIERVIGQWITGEQRGYCFGFEGPPGVGKTSLARKGLANCLKDHDGSSRPFSFIALGGSSNASTLSGHNYTYVGSTWGRIVDILMESKCMNPIIFIDELDKVSRTENGKEIIGILTHLIDPTQNESFQDKYFSGIDIDMSKVLFIFSYNDVSIIDRILLDRIHRVKFDNLTLDDKLEICHNYILPELFKNVGFKNIINFTDDILRFIIDNYTQEAGVRKLKELLFEIISEINLEILNNEKDYDLPIEISEEDIKNKYFKEKYKKNMKKIHKSSQVGIMNGLWANSMGMGGIIPIETFLFPSSTFLDLKLTGMQGDVMKESMNVAKTLAWKLTPAKKKTALLKQFEKDKLQGIHIHCPEGAVPKDGPSAGTAITVAVFSLLNNKKINHKLAITGEINLQGRVTAIGGLELKILGGIKAGITHFIFPKENDNQYNLFLEKYKDKNIIPKETKFTSVEDISEVLKLVYV